MTVIRPSSGFTRTFTVKLPFLKFNEKSGGDTFTETRFKNNQINRPDRTYSGCHHMFGVQETKVLVRSLVDWRTEVDWHRSGSFTHRQTSIVPSSVVTLNVFLRRNIFLFWGWGGGILFLLLRVFRFWIENLVPHHALSITGFHSLSILSIDVACACGAHAHIMP
jgi:hypothetical protein